MDGQKTIDITNLPPKDILKYCQKACSGNGVFSIQYGIVNKRWMNVTTGSACFVEESRENGLVYNRQKEILKLEDLGLVKGYLALWIDDYFISTESGKAIMLDLWDAQKIEFTEI